MIKSAFLYDVDNIPDHLSDLERLLAVSPFVECSPTQEYSIGALAPRAIPHSTFVESVDGGRHWLAMIGIQKKSVPGSVIRKQVAKLAAEVEKAQGRKPGKKEKREMAEEVLLQMLPHAFPKDAHILVWFDRTTRLLTLGAGSIAQADECITFLIKHVDGLVVRPLQTQTSPAAQMSAWLLDGEASGQLLLGKSCEMTSCDEEKACVKYSRHSLKLDQIREHLEMGKMPSKLDLLFDDRVAFTMTSDLQLKKIKLTKTALDKDRHNNDDDFDADVALMTSELALMEEELLAALGGKLEGFRTPQ